MWDLVICLFEVCSCHVYIFPSIFLTLLECLGLYIIGHSCLKFFAAYVLFFGETARSLQASQKFLLLLWHYCYSGEYWKNAGALRCHLHSTSYLFSNSVCKNSDSYPWARNCFHLLSGSYSSLWWDQLFISTDGLVEFSRIFLTIPQHSRNRKYEVISYFFVLFSASSLIIVTESFCLTVKTEAHMTWSSYIMPIQCLLCGGR